MIVLTDNMPHLESASLGIWVKAGSRSEHASEHGISHVLEHMAFKGTSTRNAREIAEAIENVGGDLNAATSVEHTGYFARVLKEDVALAGDILADIVQNSALDQDELDRERQVIVQEIGATRDNPDDHVFDLFQSAAYPDQPIGRTILGTVDSVRSFEPEAIRSYMDRNYVGDHMVICGAGAVDHDALVDIANDRFHDLRPTGAPEPERARYTGGEERVLSDHEQAHIVLGFEGRAYNSDGFYAAQILASILGGGMSSRLFQEVREKRGLCYSVYAFHWGFSDTGIFGIHAATGGENLPELVPVIIDELRKSSERIDQQEIERSRAQIRAQLLMGQESPAARAGQIARQMMLYGRTIPNQEMMERLAGITTERLTDLAGRLFFDTAPTLSAIGPVDHLVSLDEIAGALCDKPLGHGQGPDAADQDHGDFEPLL